jgi:LPS sulfotransferase NodH
LFKIGGFQLEYPPLAERLIVLLSHERSGSHLLTDLLASTGEIRSVDEVCNFNAVKPEESSASYFRFRQELYARRPELAYRPNNENQSLLLDSYFRRLLDLEHAVGKHVIVDVKYGHIHNFEVGWWPSEHRPFLFNYLTRNNIRVIHLRRRDSVGAIISAYVAERTKTWHKKSGDRPIDVEKMRVPSQQIASDALALEREKENATDWLAGGRVFDITYEQLGTNASTRSEVLQGLLAFLGVVGSADELMTNHEKITPPLAEIVENLPELRRVVTLFGRGRLLLPQ